MHQKKRNKITAAVTAIMFLANSLELQAGTTWVGTNAGNDLTNTTNWGGALPLSTDTVTFSGSGSYTPAPFVSATGFTVGGMTFTTSPNNPITASGGGILTVGAGGVDASNTGANTASFLITGSSSSLTINGTASNHTASNIGTVNYTVENGGTLSFMVGGESSGSLVNVDIGRTGGPGSFNTGTTPVVIDVLNSSNVADILHFSGPVTIGNDNNAQIITGNIASTSDFTKAGIDTISLLGTNSILGTITINAGTLQGEGTFSIPNTTIVNNGTLEFSSGTDTTYTGAMSGTGNLLIDTNTNLTLTTSGTGTGNTTVIGPSSVAISDAEQLPSGSITLNNDATLVAYDSLIFTSMTTNSIVTTGSGPAVIQTSSPVSIQIPVNNGAGLESSGLGTVTISGLVSGAGALAAANGSTLILSNNSNSYQGGSGAFNGGTLSISNDSQLGLTTSELVLDSGGTLDISADVELNANRPVLIQGGSGSFVLNENELTVDDQITMTGALTVYGVTSTATSGDGSVNLTSMQGFGALTLENGAQATLHANNTYSGPITVTGYGRTGDDNANITGIITSNNLGDDSNGNGLTLSDNALVGFTGGGTITFTGRPVGISSGEVFVNVDSNTTVIWEGNTNNGDGDGILNKVNSGILNISGTLEGFSNPTSTTAGFEVLEGTLQFGSAANFPTDLNIDNLDTLDFQFSGSATANGLLTGGTSTGELQIDGGATVTLTNTGNTYGGGTVVGSSFGAGTVIVSLDSNLGNVGGDLTLNGNGTLQTTATSGHARNVDFSNLNGNSNQVDVPSTDTVPFSGSLYGTGGFTKTDTGTMVLTGTNNTYAGLTTITGGTLQTGSQNLPVAAPINVGSSGTLDFAQVSDGTYSGVLSGSGNITTVNSTSKLTITNNSSGFSGTTTIPAGELYTADGSLLGGSFNVNIGGILSGLGTLGGVGQTLTSLGGTIHPGSSPGIMTYLGNAVLTNGTFAVDINGEGNTPGLNNSELVVSGTATLGGGESVLVTSNDGSFYFAGDYTILNAASVSGEFNPNVLTVNALTGLPLLVTPVLTYDGQDAYLDFQTPMFELTVNHNEYVVLEQLASIVDPNPAETTLLANLTSLNSNGFLAALDDLSGAQYAQLLLANELTTNQFLRRLYDPVRSIIATDPCCAVAEPCGYNITTWIDGSGSRAFFKDTHEADGFKVNGYQVSGGIQATFDSDLTLGLAATYEKDHYGFNIGGSSGKSDTVLGSIYGLYRPDKYYILTDLVLGASRNKVERTFAIGSVTYSEEGQPRNIQGALYIEAGFDLACSYYNLQPFAGIQGGYFDSHKFEESGTDPVALGFQNQSYGMADSRLGVHFTTNSEECGFVVSADFAWQYRLNKHENSRDAYFQDFGTVFDLEGSRLDRNAFDWGVNITHGLSDALSVYASANGQQWKNVSAYNVTGGLNLSW